MEAIMGTDTVQEAAQSTPIVINGRRVKVPGADDLVRRTGPACVRRRAAGRQDGRLRRDLPGRGAAESPGHVGAGRIGGTQARDDLQCHTG